MIKVLTAAEMRDVDRLTTEEFGIPSIILMENAARSVADSIGKRLGGSVVDRRFVILCGKGNNGGDGAALARILWGRGAEVRVELIGDVTETDGDARTNFEALARIAALEGSPAIRFEQAGLDEVEERLEGAEGPGPGTVFVDAVFGTGVARPLSGGYEKLVDRLARLRQSSGSLWVSVDLPSGLASDSAVPIGPHINADLTVTFTAPKIANVMPPAMHASGELIIADIGSPRELVDRSPSKTFVAESSDARAWLRATRFAEDSYKNVRGHALLVVGSRDYSGAAALAGNGAMRSGAGLVTVATTRSAQAAIAEKTLEEVITRGLAETPDGRLAPEAFTAIAELTGKAQAIGIGCGLGVGDNRGRIRELVLDRKVPAVIDADGLNALAPFDIYGSIGPDLVLTPHEGEFRRLLGAGECLSEDRVACVREFAIKYGVIVMLKGERVLIGDPSGRVVINPTGNSGLGKAGNGDNLTGFVTGCVAQAAAFGVPVFETVVAAVFIAGRAADIARERFGERVMLASDVRECLSAAFAEIEHDD